MQGEESQGHRMEYGVLTQWEWIGSWVVLQSRKSEEDRSQQRKQ